MNRRPCSWLVGWLVLSVFASAAPLAAMGPMIRLSDVFGQESAAFAIGEWIEVTVIDPGLDVSPSVDAHTFWASSAPTGHHISFPVTETSQGVFRGRFETSAGDSVDRLWLNPGDTLSVGLAPGDPGSATATAAESRLVFVDFPAETETDTVLEDGTVGLRLFAPEANHDPGARESAQVYLSSRLGQDSELVYLQESAVDSGIFAGLVSVPRQRPGWTPGDQQMSVATDLQTGAADVVDAAPGYPLSGFGDSVAVRFARVEVLDRAGRPTSVVVRGRPLRLRVVAPNLAQGFGVDTLAVTVSGLEASGSDVETVLLAETDRYSQIFEGSLPSAESSGSAVPGNGIFEPGASGQVRVRSLDYSGLTTSEALAELEDGVAEFVDDRGDPTDAVVQNGVVRIRIDSPFGNADADEVEFLAFVVTDDPTGDAEYLTFWETAPDSGVFLGSLPLQANSSTIPSNGVLETNASGSPFLPTNRIVTNVFGTAIGAPVIGARPFFLDRFARRTTRIVAGEAARVGVEMPLADNDPASPDVLVVTLDNEQFPGDHADLVLTETGPTTGVFTALIPSAYRAGTTDWPNQIDLALDDELRLEVVDGWGAAWSARASAAYGRFDWVDRDGRPIPSALEGSDVMLEATAPSEDVSSGFDFVSGYANSEIVADYRSFGLGETGPSTGIFRGGIALRTAATADYDSYALETYELPGPPHRFDRVDVGVYFLDYGLYYDAQPLSLTGSRTALVDGARHPVATVAVGSTVSLQVEDWNGDRFSSPAGTATTTVRVRGSATGDEELVTLVQDARESAIYRGTVEIVQGTSSTPGDGVVAVQPGELLVAEHDDLLGLSFSLAEATVAVAAVEIVDLQGLPTLEVFENGVARLRVISLDSDLSTFPDNLAVQLSSAVAGDAEWVSLTETGPETHVFEGTVALPFGSAQAGDGSLQVAGPPDTVTARFGSARASAQTIGARAALRDAQGGAPAAFAAGETLTLEIVDPSRDLTPGIDSVPVELHSRLNNARLATNAYEVAPGLFRADVTVHLSTHATAGTLTVTRNDTVEIVGYQELQSGRTVTAVAGIVDFRTFFLDDAGRPTTEVLESAPLRVRLIGEPADRFAYPEAVEMYASAEIGPDYENPYLVETGNHTGVFEGTLWTRLSNTPEAFNGQLETYESSGPPVALDHVQIRPFLTGPDYPLDTGFGAEATARGSRIAFVDGTGAAVASVVLGTELRVRVWDWNRNVTFDDPGEPADTATATLTVGSDGETVILTEVAPGVFDGTLPSRFGPATPNDGWLEGDGEHLRVLARHEDLLGLTSSAVEVAVEVTVPPVNEPPVALPDTVSTTMEATITFDILSNDSDVDGDTLAIVALGTPTNGTVELFSSDSLRYTPNAAFAGTDTFSYTVSDGQGGTAEATVTMIVSRPARIDTHLQVLYDFAEGQGDTVLDTSGVGTPLHLTIDNPGAVTWGSGRLTIDSATLIQSAGPASKVIDAVRASSQVTMEAWALPANRTQTGPAAIITISQATNKRDVTLGQSAKRWDTRLRTSTSGAGGVNLLTADNSLSLDGLTHVVFTRDAAGAVKAYLNGVLASSFTTTGTLAAWITSYKLGLAAELNGGRPWLGDLDLVAIYSRALTPTEVRQNYLAGPQ